GQGRDARGCRFPRRVRSRVMANPAMPLGDPDATIVVGGADADATLVVGGAPAARPAAPPTHTSSSQPQAGNAARVEFLRKVQARALAKTKAADPTLAATVTTTGSPSAP